MQLKYNLNDKPPVIHTLLYGLQWLVIAIPNVVTIGMLAKLQFGDDIQMQTSYLQSVYFVLGLTMLVQAFWGHRLPLVVGPAAVLIVGILSASASSSFNAIYTAVAIGGATLLLLSVSGLLGKVARIFTPRVIVVILGLIAMTLAPVIISLLFGEGHDLFSFAFFLVGLIATFALERFLRGVGKSLTVMIVTVAGSFVYFLFNGMPEVQSAGYTTDIDKLIIKPEVDIPVVISFLVCFFALLINELGSIESVRSLIGATDNGKMRRDRRRQHPCRHDGRDRPCGLFYFSWNHLIHTLRLARHNRPLRHRTARMRLYARRRGVAHPASECRNRTDSVVCRYSPACCSVQYDVGEENSQVVRPRFDHRAASDCGSSCGIYSAHCRRRFADSLAPNSHKRICYWCSISRFS